MKLLPLLARWCALLAGLLMTGTTLMTCGNLILRNTTGQSMAGAFELTALATGAAIALFMPLCQVRQGHIVVDFFTAKLSVATNHVLDRIGACVLASVFALLAWRTTLGGLSAYNAHSQTMLMEVPEWIVHAAMVPPFALACVIGLAQSLFGFDALKDKP